MNGYERYMNGYERYMNGYERYMNGIKSYDIDNKVAKLKLFYLLSSSLQTLLMAVIRLMLLWVAPANSFNLFTAGSIIE